MKLKLIVDFNNPDMKNMVDYLFEYNKNDILDIEYVGFSQTKAEHSLNRPYYGMYYANRMGNTLPYLKAMFDAKDNGIDIHSLQNIADIYEGIGYKSVDMIDAIIEGDYEAMHDVYYQILSNKGIKQGGLCIAYETNNPENETVCDLEMLKKLEF